jgi:hypothetical protein
MKPAVVWTAGGNFQIVDQEDNSLMAELTLYEPLSNMAINNPMDVAQEILTAMVETPHPRQQEEIAS